MSEFKFCCYECKEEVPAQNHFTATDGKILCDKCSKGIEPMSKELLEKIKEMQK